MSRYALVCASSFSAEDFFARFSKGEFDIVVAVDSGYRHLEQLGVEPTYVLGDFDSLGYVPEGAFVHPAIKDKSDLELALDFAVEHGADDVMVYGCLGGRLDHTLAALQNIAQMAESGIRIRAVDVPQGDASCANGRRPRAAIVEPLPGPIVLELAVADGSEPEVVPDLGAPTFGSVSVFASTDEALGVSESGMFYPLDDAVLTNRTSLGLSNELVERTGLISVAKGTVYALYPSDFATTRRPL